MKELEGSIASRAPPSTLDGDSDEEMRNLMCPDDTNDNPTDQAGGTVEEFQLNGTRGVAFAAYQNEEITDFFIWNDKEAPDKKNRDQL